MSYEFDPNYPTPSITVEFFDDDGLALDSLTSDDIDAIPYRKDGIGFAETITTVDLSGLNDPWQEGGFLAIGNGQYRLDLPASMCAVTAPTSYVVFHDNDGFHMSREEVRITREAAIAGKVDLLGSADIEIVGPVATDGQSITLFVGGSYLAATSNALAWNLASPNLTGYTINFGLGPPTGPAILQKAGTVIDGGLSTQKIRVELTAAETLLYLAGRENQSLVFTIVGVSGSTRLPLVSGGCLVRRNYAA